MSEASLISVLMMALLGGPSDLLDYIPSDAYWQAKGVPVNVEQMTAQLGAIKVEDISALIAKMGSEDIGEREAATKKILAMGPGVIPQVKKATASPEAEIADRARKILEQLSRAGSASDVRRLMAIRTLGELKKKEGLAALRPFVESKDVFVAEYARAAINAIEPVPGPFRARPEPDPKTRAADLAVLPAEADFVAQAWAHPLANPPLSAAAILAKAAFRKGDRDAQQKELMQNIIQVAEMFGNVRVEGATCSAAMDPARGEPQSAVIVVRGLYNSAGVRQALAQLPKGDAPDGQPAADVEGVPAVKLDRHCTVLLPSDDRCVFIMGDNEEKMPIKETAAALKSGKGQFATSRVSAAMVAHADTRAVFWAALVPPDAWKAEAVIKPVNALVASIVMRGPNAEVTMTAHGSDAAELADAADRAEEFIDLAIGGIGEQFAPWRHGGEAGKRPAFARDLVRGLKSIHSKVEGKTATFTGTFPNPVTSLGLLPALDRMGREEYDLNDEPGAHAEGVPPAAP